MNIRSSRAALISFVLVNVATTAQLLLVPEWLGIWLLLVAGWGLAVATSGPLYLVSLLTVPLAIAFDSFLRVDPTFYFYRGNGLSVGELCSVTASTLSLLLLIEKLAQRSLSASSLRLQVALPSVPAAAFAPLIGVTLFATFFVTRNAQTFLSASFENAQLAKFPWLEYVALVLILLLRSARNSRPMLIAALLACIGYVAATLLASYRMVALISAAAIFLTLANGRRMSRLAITSAATVAYLGLSSIAYFRQGNFDVDLGLLLGYQHGRLDNTFTGVIETALIYTAIGAGQDWTTTLAHLVGTILPLPNTLIPEALQYAPQALANYFMPGGGLFSGFLVYFNFILLPIALGYVAFALRYGYTKQLAAGAYISLFITAPRWWLYGPYSIFKFFGVYAVLLALVVLASRLTLRRGAASRAVV